MAKTKLTESRELPLPPLTVQNHAWGCVYTGTKSQIVGSGLIRFEDWPSFSKGQFTFEAQSVINGERRRITIEKNYCPTETNPGELWIHYKDVERDSASRVQRALGEVATLHAQILEAIATIRPKRLSEILAIPANPTSPKPDSCGDAN